MTISNDTRGRVKKIGEPIALFFGRLGLTPDGLTLIGFAHHDRRRRPPRPPALAGRRPRRLRRRRLRHVRRHAGPGDGPGQQARRLHGLRLRPLGRGARLRRHRGRPARPAAGRRAVLAAAAMASAFLVSYARAKSEGLGFSAGHRDGGRRPDAPRDPARHPVPRPRPRAACSAPRRARPARGAGAPRSRSGILVIEVALGDHRHRRDDHGHPARPPHARPGPLGRADAAARDGGRDRAS